ncbi:hypothetical protein [Flavivirga spongiicola]|uniref:Apea-like HEPN domain-containing protein n=1 Tax=Flavivirga spongiicola TaxID=421621 RepID=A0ABU7XSS5_9FLAO|nr:hypothetical protein [Flavivirga sp. MEBiC05379]MDO5978793.1 hypothetical protein [Flavivirga sp. MEBiC05379]
MNDNEIKKIFNFLEELSWVFKSHKNVDLNDFLNEIRINQNIRNSIMHGTINESRLSEKDRLIGILPKLLNDKKLFSRNSDLIDFAESTFNISISRPEKRSRYEIIGLVIIEILELKNNRVLDITDAIQSLTSNTKFKTMLKKKKNSPNFSWNEAIREITNQ